MHAGPRATQGAAGAPAGREAGPATGGWARGDRWRLAGRPRSPWPPLWSHTPGREAPRSEGLGAPDLRGRPWLLPRGGTGPGGGLRAQRTPLRESGVSFQGICLAAGDVPWFITGHTPTLGGLCEWSPALPPPGFRDPLFQNQAPSSGGVRSRPPFAVWHTVCE